jgi:hypothetical protein
LLDAVINNFLASIARNDKWRGLRLTAALDLCAERMGFAFTAALTAMATNCDGRHTGEPAINDRPQAAVAQAARTLAEFAKRG